MRTVGYVRTVAAPTGADACTERPWMATVATNVAMVGVVACGMT